MNNFECTVTIADIYGAEWWSRNKEELDREWEWGFGVSDGEQTVASIYCGNLVPIHQSGIYIILHRRKPKPPMLRDVYGVDAVTIPVGWEWTGEWRDTRRGEMYRCVNPCAVMETGSIPIENAPRLIIRERPKKVWYRAEEKTRVPRNGDWFFSYGSWHFANTTGDAVYLCATRHEEVDQTVQVVTQAMVDEGVGR